ncbi:hypothetical protein BPUM_0092 [Bacillus pumilus SAFR-032]|uniref:Uncharacterized protein n=1 Tax=Bacillus pumilus (strain SAFR-032) TaxID=315750 RepID=A8F975_BACP2|nr:hypothetical protein BPUM_0092 [Bacillus pumilus SAFR-032]
MRIICVKSISAFQMSVKKYFYKTKEKRVSKIRKPHPKTNTDFISFPKYA